MVLQENSDLGLFRHNYLIQSHDDESRLRMHNYTIIGQGVPEIQGVTVQDLLYRCEFGKNVKNVNTAIPRFVRFRLVRSSKY